MWEKFKKRRGQSAEKGRRREDDIEDTWERKIQKRKRSEEVKKSKRRRKENEVKSQTGRQAGRREGQRPDLCQHSDPQGARMMQEMGRWQQSSVCFRPLLIFAHNTCTLSYVP